MKEHQQTQRPREENEEIRGKPSPGAFATATA